MKSLLMIIALVLANAAVAQTVTGKVVGVSDGDTITVLTEAKERIRIRLSEIDAPESKQAFGQASKRALSDICFGQSAQFDASRKDRYGRVVSRVSCNGIDTQSYMVGKGMAWVYTRYSTDMHLRMLEQKARSERVGLWQDASPTPPWEFRRQK